MSTVQLKGLSGNLYQYNVHGMNGTWNDIAGNYAFAKFNGMSWTILYLGICDSFKSRMSSHERWDEAVRKGATHVLAHVNKNKSFREAEEQDLIASLQPVMNTQHKSAVGGLAAALLYGGSHPITR